MTSDAAVAMALDVPAQAGPGSRPDGESVPAGSPAAALAPPGRLTAREREIVALIAEGDSNRAIADKLYISPATAARHVANILEKLGFNSRAQVAAWASARPPG